MKLNDILPAIDYMFGNGGNYLWACYGNSAHIINFNNIHGKPIGSIIFDTSTADVCEVSVEIPGEPVAYRWSPEFYKYAHRVESIDRGLDPDIAWDDVMYTDLETKEDIIEKVTAIVNDQEVDRTVIVPISLTETEELELHRQAHAVGMSTNEYVNFILRIDVDRLKAAEKAADDKAHYDRYVR